MDSAGARRTCSSSSRASCASLASSSHTWTHPWKTNGSAAGMAGGPLMPAKRDGSAPMRVLMLTREYPPHVYGGAGVVVDHLSRALAGRAAVEVRCFGGDERSEPGLRVRGYASWERLAGRGEARYAVALEALSTDLLMARDPVAADVVNAHTWYVALAGLLVRALFDIPLVVTLHSLEPLRPWKAEQLGRGYEVSSWAERAAVEAADR